YNDVLTTSSSAASNYNITYVNGSLVIAPKTLTITNPTVSNKVYDSGTTATVSSTGTLSGFIGTQTVTVASSSATFVGVGNVGTGISVTVSYTLANGANGGLASNYTVSNSTVTANITAKALTISNETVSNKVYDSTNAATLNTASATLVGAIAGDVVTLNTASASATFASTNVGTAIAVTVTGNALIGSDAGNYTLTQPTGLTANITQKALTASMVVADKTYDGNTTATPTFTIISGLVGSQTLTVTGTATFGSSNAGTQTATAQTVSLSNGSGLASNYSLSAGQTDTATINKATLTASMTVAGKTYDNTTTATPTFTITNGLVGSQTLVVTGTATFALSDAGVQTATAQTVSLANGTNGGLASNYSLSAGQT
ncbi:MAG: hypothetical protein EBT01_03500, partial [Proteobacteria bacterium]|nr:hypothetical protein [Candidatus Fonsibacter sp. PEL3]